MIYTITKIELTKLFHKKPAVWMIISVCIFQVIATIIHYNLKSKNIEIPTGYQFTAFSFKTALQLMTLIILVISTVSMSEEMSSGTIKTILARHIRRMDLIWGKFFSILIISFGLILIMHVIGVILGEIMGGLVPLKEGEYLVYSAKKLFSNSVIGSLLTLPPIIALVSFGLFISTAVKESGWSVGTGIIALFLLQILSQFENIQKYLFSHYLFLPINNVVRLTQGIFIDWSDDVYRIIGVSIIYATIFMVASIIIFNKKDI